MRSRERKATAVLTYPNYTETELLMLFVFHFVSLLELFHFGRILKSPDNVSVYTTVTQCLSNEVSERGRE